MHKGPNTTLDEVQTLIPSGGGFDAVEVVNGNSTPETANDCAFPLRSNDGSGNRQAIAFHPTQDPISHADGSTHAMGTGSKQGCATVAVAINGMTLNKELTDKQMTGISEPGDPMFCLRGQGQQHAVSVDQYNGALSDPQPTLGSNCGVSTGRNGVMASMSVRRLTPTECERLQGFPDGWTAGFADSTRYKMLGNAVCRNVGEWLALRIKKGMQ